MKRISALGTRGSVFTPSSTNCPHDRRALPAYENRSMIRPSAGADRELGVRVPERVERRVGHRIRLPYEAVDDLVVLVDSGSALRSKKSALSATRNPLSAFTVPAHHVRHALSTLKRIVRARRERIRSASAPERSRSGW